MGGDDYTRAGESSEKQGRGLKVANHRFVVEIAAAAEGSAGLAL